MATHRLSAGSGGSMSPRVLKDQHSWTDDLPVCHLSGVGFATNQRYREDGFRQEEHEFEDRSIHFSPGGSTYLYGVFDGHDSCRVSHFAAQRMPAELLLGQLDDAHTEDAAATDRKINQILHQAFIAVEKGYIDSIDDELVERANLDIPEGVDDFALQTQYPELYKQLQTINGRIGGGATAVVALVHCNTLYIANVGASRALLCKTDKEGQIRVFQLSVDHNLDNEDELMRLKGIGVDVDKLSQVGHIGNKTYTRTIGDCLFKNSYKNEECFTEATSEPLIATPEVTNGIPIDSSCSFLILMSYGVYKSIEDATGTKHVNADIAAMVGSEFSVQTTLNGVAQAVVDKIVRLHHDTFMTTTDLQQKRLCQERKDITLLVRNFHYCLPNATRSPVSSSTANPFALAMRSSLIANKNPALDTPLSISVQDPKPGSETAYRPFFPIITSRTLTGCSTMSNPNEFTSSTYSSTNDSTNSTEDSQGPTRSHRSSAGLPLDSDGKIASYVDFSGYFEGLKALGQEEREKFEADLEPKPGYETIPEEKEVTMETTEAA